MSTPIDTFLNTRGFLMLDGGLATELERLGHDLDHPLWSAHVLLTQPDDIIKIHRSYLEAGADCITAASYQASMPGFVAQGLEIAEAQSLIIRSVELACQARTAFVQQHQIQDQLSPLVAASIGPYGAFLANGSEFCGNYDISKKDLHSFHEQRWHLLATTSADLFACETIPSFQEAEVLLQLFREMPERFGWVSFSCRDETCISDGTPIADCAALFSDRPNIVAIGINCTAPKYVPALIRELRESAPEKPVVVYPNSGETFDAGTRRWVGVSDPIDFGKASCDWRKVGARLIGGCCRTGPLHIKAMKAALSDRGTTVSKGSDASTGLKKGLG